MKQGMGLSQSLRAKAEGLKKRAGTATGGPSKEGISPLRRGGRREKKETFDLHNGKRETFEGKDEQGGWEDER
jgi:hypothetical protein